MEYIITIAKNAHDYKRNDEIKRSRARLVTLVRTDNGKVRTVADAHYKAIPNVSGAMPEVIESKTQAVTAAMLAKANGTTLALARAGIEGAKQLLKRISESEANTPMSILSKVEAMHILSDLIEAAEEKERALAEANRKAARGE